MANSRENLSLCGLGITVRTGQDPGVRAIGTAVVSLAEGKEKAGNGGEEVRDRDANKKGKNIRSVFLFCFCKVKKKARGP